MAPAVEKMCPVRGQGRVLLNNSASPAGAGGGGGANTPAPSDPEFVVGKNEILQKEILIWLFLVHDLLDF